MKPNKCQFPGCHKGATKVFRGETEDQHLCEDHHKQAYKTFSLIVFGNALWRCQYCGRTKPLQVHHVTYRSQGGRDVLDNCRALCAKCHEKEHNR